jgi:hypothetical protein
VSVQPPPVGTVLTGPVRQIGYVVTDLDAAIADALAVGIGPWFTVRDMPQEDVAYRGAPCRPVLSLAFANSGDMQVEIIQQTGGTPSIYTEFIEAGGDGYNQLAWWVDDFAAMEARADAAGWTQVYGGDAGGARFAYYETAGKLATIVEVMEMTGTTKWMTDTVREAAESWDPTDPDQPAVRSLF